MTEHDVTLTSFVGNLSQVLEQFLDTMCKKNVREETESLMTIGAVILKISRKDWREGGKKISSPTRARVKGFTQMWVQFEESANPLA